MIREWLIGLLEWLTGIDNVRGLKESCRISESRREEYLNGLHVIHDYLTPGEPWYTWQRVYQNVYRLKERGCPCPPENDGRVEHRAGCDNHGLAVARRLAERVLALEDKPCPG